MGLFQNQDARRGSPRAKALGVLWERLKEHPLARVGPGLVLHEADGRFSADAEAVLRDAAPLPDRA